MNGEEKDLKEVKLLLAAFFGQGILSKWVNYTEADFPTLVQRSYAIAELFIAEYKKDAGSGS